MFKFSQDSASVLLEQNRDELMCFILKRVDCPDTAEDILQDAYFRLMQVESETEIENARAYLYKIVGNLAIDNLRKNSRNQALEVDVLFDMADGSPDFERQIYSQQQIAHLKLAIAELPPRSRDVFVMHKFKHYPYSKIMSELGIAESTVLQHIVKAMAHCRKRMGELDQTNNP